MVSWIFTFCISELTFNCYGHYRPNSAVSEDIFQNQWLANIFLPQYFQLRINELHGLCTSSPYSLKSLHTKKHLQPAFRFIWSEQKTFSRRDAGGRGPAEFRDSCVSHYEHDNWSDHITQRSTQPSAVGLDVLVAKADVLWLEDLSVGRLAADDDIQLVHRFHHSPEKQKFIINMDRTVSFLSIAFTLSEAKKKGRKKKKGLSEDVTKFRTSARLNESGDLIRGGFIQPDRLSSVAADIGMFHQHLGLINLPV